MSKHEFYATEDLGISIERTDDESGDIIMTVTANGGEITINCGPALDDAWQLHDELNKATQVAFDLRDNWENRPDEEDGYVFSGRDGYFAKLSGTQAGPFPSQDVATYELARMMATADFFPDSWWQNERGTLSSTVDAVGAYLDDGKIKPLDGVRFADGDEVLVPAEDWRHWVVDHDYGNLGVMVHTYGDSSVNMLATHDQLQPYDEDDEEK